MESWLTYIITKSLSYLYIIVFVVSFLESLTLIGLFLPGIVLMAGLGTLIGHGSLNFYSSWIAGIIGCSLGDWTSYYIGWRFKNWLHNLSLLKKHQFILKKIKNTLYKHNIITILIGRFIGPTRPLVPMVCGMLKLPLKKFIIPSIIGCLLWPPIYFLPGVLAGIVINTPFDQINNNFKWCILAILSLIWFTLWISWRWWKFKKYGYIIFSLSEKKMKYLTMISTLISIISIISIQFHPEMKVFQKTLGIIFL
ncbi:DedA family protein [Buchnera aphidicola]|uniref:DedA family protein n=1 Tax=Buchnera aphidicola TaxID=9 RepID=UPI003463A57C